MHIEGYDKTRILSPEAQAKLDTRRAEKAKKDAEELAAKEAADKKAAEEKAAKDAADAKAAGVAPAVAGAVVAGKAAPSATVKGKKK